MSSVTATKCDRCGSETLGYPSNWGSVRVYRSNPFLDTNTLDLCDKCLEVVYCTVMMKERAESAPKNLATCRHGNEFQDCNACGGGDRDR